MLTANAEFGNTTFFLVHGRDWLVFPDVSLLPPPNKEMLDSISDSATRKWFTQWRKQTVEHSCQRVTVMLRHTQLLLTYTDKYAEKLSREYELGELVWVRNTTTVTGEGLAKKWQPNYFTIPHPSVEAFQSAVQPLPFFIKNKKKAAVLAGDVACGRRDPHMRSFCS